MCVFDFEKTLIDYVLDRELVQEWMLIRKKRNLASCIFAFSTSISRIGRAGGEKMKISSMIQYPAPHPLLLTPYSLPLTPHSSPNP